MNSTDLPQLPSTPVVDPEVCDLVSLYLAVSHDLTEEQKRRVTTHLQICQKCVHEYHLVRRAAQLVSSLEESEPSARVDVAVMAAIAARTATTNGSLNAVRPLRPTAYSRNSGSSRRSRIPVGGLVAAAAVLIVAFVGLLHFVIMPSSSAKAFQVPASAWNGVLYHTQTVVDSDGAQYHVTTYHDMATDKMNVETTMSGKLDVMAVSNGKNTVVGMDMMHDVTQTNANSWLTDDSLFDVKKLNADLQAGRAKYLGKSQFAGQEVYEVRDDNGDIILLNMQYKPVNVLQPTNGSSTGKPMYDKVQILSSAPAGTWDTTPPTNFKTGQLPAKP
jgi:hypothetical protein